MIRVGLRLSFADPAGFRVVDEIASEARADVNRVAVNGEDGFELFIYLYLGRTILSECDVQVFPVLENLVIGKTCTSHHSYYIIRA